MIYDKKFLVNNPSEDSNRSPEKRNLDKTLLFWQQKKLMIFLHPKCSPLVVREPQSNLSSIAVVRLSSKQKMQGLIASEGDYPLVITSR